MVYTTRTPTEIQFEINKLKTELEASINERVWVKIWDDEVHSDKHLKIGLFNLTKQKTLLSLLNDGQTLKIEHSACGNHEVKMNPQRNRILVEPIGNSSNSNINEERILGFLIWNAGNWYIKNEEYGSIK